MDQCNSSMPRTLEYWTMIKRRHNRIAYCLVIVIHVQKFICNFTHIVSYAEANPTILQHYLNKSKVCESKRQNRNREENISCNSQDENSNKSTRPLPSLKGNTRRFLTTFPAVNTALQLLWFDLKMVQPFRNLTLNHFKEFVSSHIFMNYGKK